MPNEATNGLAPSVLDFLSGAARAASYEFPPASEVDPRQETLGLDSHLALEAWCFRKGTLQAIEPKTGVPRRGHRTPTNVQRGYRLVGTVVLFFLFFGRS